MQTRTVSSDRARNNWGEIIEAASAGEVVDVERYGRSVAVVISRKLFDRLQASHLAMLGYISREAERTGNEISFAPGDPKPLYLVIQKSAKCRSIHLFACVLGCLVDGAGCALGEGVGRGELSRMVQRSGEAAVHQIANGNRHEMQRKISQRLISPSSQM